MSEDSKKTILLAEDEEMLRGTLRDLLTSEGFMVLEAVDGEQAIDMSLAHHPDLLLLDIQMPKKTGLEALGEIRRDPWGSKVPVVILTNMGDVNNISGAVDLDAHEYLVKADMSLEDVMATVKRKLGVTS